MKMEDAIRVFPEQSICMLFSSFRRRRQRILGNSEEAASLIGEAIETQTITLYLTLVWSRNSILLYRRLRRASAHRSRSTTNITRLLLHALKHRITSAFYRFHTMMIIQQNFASPNGMRTCQLTNAHCVKSCMQKSLNVSNKNHVDSHLSFAFFFFAFTLFAAQCRRIFWTAGKLLLIDVD